MFQRLRNFIRNNWRKVALGGVAGWVFVGLTRIAARRYLTYQETRSRSFLRSMKKQQLFEMMEENFTSTFRTWFELMKDNIKKNLNADQLTDMLKKGEGSKYENWMELKIMAFSSVLSLVYGSAMLSVLARIQVNVISGMLFRQMDEVPPGLEDLEGAGARLITEDLQQKYMALTRYLCTDGMDVLCNYIQSNAYDIVSKLSLKQQFTVADIEQILYVIRAQKMNAESKQHGVEDWHPIKDTYRYIFSKRNIMQYLKSQERHHIKTENGEDAILHTLMSETYDLVESEDVKTILQFLETLGFNHYLDKISDFLSMFPQPNENDNSLVSEESGNTDAPSHHDIPQPAAPLAKIVPIMNAFIEVETAEDSWVSVLLTNESLRSFSANVYESYCSKQFD